MIERNKCLNQLINVKMDFQKLFLTFVDVENLPLYLRWTLVT